MRKEDKKLLMAQAQMLVMLGIAVEKERKNLKNLVEQGVPYGDPRMVETLERFEEANAEWYRLEVEHLELRKRLGISI